MIDIRAIAQQLVLELGQESDKMRVRAEGVQLLYDRIAAAAEEHGRQQSEQHSVPAREEAEPKQES